MHDSVRQVETVFFLLLFFVIFFGALARRLKIAYPIVLVIAGLIVSLVPGLPVVRLNPDVVFLAVLPPLLFHAAWITSWREFRYNLASILMLAFGLVAFTVIGVALAAGTLFPLLDWRTGIILGAIVAPTDAIAATSIARRLRLPERIVDVLEGESLVNDATGLLALELGIGLVIGNNTPSVAEEGLRLFWLIIAGIGIGLTVAWIVRRIERFIDDGPIEITLVLITPYVAYIAAEQAHASGVLAVVACGLYLGRYSSDFFSPGSRLQAYAMSNALDFILNGLVFVLIGLQLPLVLAGLQGYGAWALLAYATGFSAFVIALRLIWVYPGAYIAYVIRRRFQGQDESLPSIKSLFVVGWTGMRGVVSLAAALSIPEYMADGQPFSSRNLIIFLTFSVILVTLVLQGLTLPPLIRLLGLSSHKGPDCEEHTARHLMISAALDYLDKAHSKALIHLPEEMAQMYDDLRSLHRTRLEGLLDQEDRYSDIQGYAAYKVVSHNLLKIERATALELRRAGRINDTVLRRLERELDLSETHISSL